MNGIHQFLELPTKQLPSSIDASRGINTDYSQKNALDGCRI